MAQRYFQAVDRGLSGIETLSAKERRESSTKLRYLILNLQRTHETLVRALEPFSSQDAKSFFERLRSKTQEELSTVYHGGQIVSEAHTHCSEVSSVVYELCSSRSNSPGFSRIQELGYSVVVQDRDVIIPLMKSILDRTQIELGLIKQAIRNNDKRRAIWIKEKYWFDIKYTYQTLRQSLDKMRKLSDELLTKIAV